MFGDQELGLSFGRMKTFEERVIKNGWPCTVFGRAFCLSDLGVLEIASIEKHVQPYGAVLVLNEEAAGKLKFGPTESFERKPAPHQVETLKKLAEVEGDQIPNELRGRAETELPGLFVADFAVVSNAVHFREGHRTTQYELVMNHFSETFRGIEDQAFRDHHIGLRSHVVELGIDAKQMPQPVLDDERRERMRREIVPEISELYARAQMLARITMPTEQFVIETARAALPSLDLDA